MVEITTLNKDIELQYSSKTNKYDLIFDRFDTKIVTGTESIQNAIKIAILTGYQELYNNPTYSDFGDKAYELLKMNQTKNVKYLLGKYIEEVIKKIRRVETVEEIRLIEEKYGYIIEYSITTIDNESVTDIFELKGGIG